jgi:hypothetical protein
VAIEARRIESVDGFIEALEALGTFKNVLPSEEQTNDAGLIEAVLEGRYLPEEPTTAEAAPAPNASTGRGRATHE